MLKSSLSLSLRDSINIFSASSLSLNSYNIFSTSSSSFNLIKRVLLFLNSFTVSPMFAFSSSNCSRAERASSLTSKEGSLSASMRTFIESLAASLPIASAQDALTAGSLSSRRRRLKTGMASKTSISARIIAILSRPAA
ncbi:MAG: hypothetical protein BWY64_02057 [bacterium ADurb.Bin363]|nr:MAG: hypothetical protein BWY64_02057 [bacterium ADurb.Bin363]